MKIIIIGAGPCGLGAAWRLNELGHDNWSLYEKNSHPGGLSASFKDSEDFWWDIGGHVLFSHYPYFDNVMDSVMDRKTDWLYHDRSAWVWMQNRFIPYPIQNNIHRLPKEVFSECLHGLLDISNQMPVSQTALQHLPIPTALKHFGDWIAAGFGQGLARHFLRPYNYKVWAYPVEELSHNWVGERVAKVDIKHIIDNHIFDRDDIAWGPNSLFRFPKYRGTGAIWEKIARKLPQEKLHLNCELKRVNLNEKTVELSDGTLKGHNIKGSDIKGSNIKSHNIQDYDILISTLPVTDLALCSCNHNQEAVQSFRSQTAQNDSKKDNCITALSKDLQFGLKYSSTHIAGLALKGNPPEHLKDKCWIYFPENDNPFYRVTVFSNYSPNNVPDINTTWSLMCEVSESPMKKVNHETIMDEIIQGAINTKLISDRTQIHHTWYQRMEKGYPTPGIQRNATLFPALKYFEANGIYSRGRFGGWRYEVGNMDHSFMQGVESAEKALYQGEELTLWYPDIVNSPHPSLKT